MNEFMIRPADVFAIVKTHRKIMSMAFAGTFVLIMLAFAVLPRKYQSETIVHIGVNYFQNPLIGDLVSQTRDPSELRSERNKTIKASLGIDFANKMGKKYGLFKTSPDSPEYSVEVEYFLKSLNITDITATQFQIQYKSKKPEIADGVVRGAIEEIRQYMYNKRISMLEQLITVLQNEITTTADDNAVRSGRMPVLGSRSEAAKAQLDSHIELLKKRMQQLLQTYNDQHPTVRGLKTELAELEAAKASGNFSPRLTRRGVFGKASAQGMLTIKDDLSKQKHLVNMALEMEKSDPSMTSYLSLIKEPVYPKNPVFPKLRLFLLFALIAGLMAAILAAAVMEFWQRSELPPTDFARRVNVEVIGTLSLKNNRSGKP